MPNNVVSRRPFRKRGQAQHTLFMASVPAPPMVVTLTYMSDLSRIRISVTALRSNTSTVLVEHSANGGPFHPVRGGGALVPAGNAVHVDDYEFPSHAQITYRVSALTSLGGVLETGTAMITVELDTVWLKSIQFPFLNRPVVVNDWSATERDFRGGVFPVVGRSFPIAVTDLRGSRRYTLDVIAHAQAQAKDLDYLLASGGPVFVHVPADCEVPQMYAVINGGSGERRAALRSSRRVFTMPLHEVATPRPSVVGSTILWQTIVSTYPTWESLQVAYPTWEAVLEGISDPSVVVVS